MGSWLACDSGGSVCLSGTDTPPSQASQLPQGIEASLKAAQLALIQCTKAVLIISGCPKGTAATAQTAGSPALHAGCHALQRCLCARTPAGSTPHGQSPFRESPPPWCGLPGPGPA